MVFIAQKETNYKLFDYILGNTKMSIATDRFYYLDKLNHQQKLKIALMDRDNNNWTKWGGFPGPLLSNKHNGVAVDVHRNMMDNEIVIESDYPDYIDNFEAAKIIGKILENKGFTPHYYYSGNKSIHTHIFLDWDCMLGIDNWKDTRKFKQEFILWLRTEMVSNWTNRQFDKDLINSTHLIRCELSKNKKGYKTFLGYTHNDLSFIPYICNEDNRIYPKLGKVILSNPNCINKLLHNFFADKKKNKPTKTSYLDPKDCPTEIRKSVGRLLSDDFNKVSDGRQRACFIIMSELRRVMGDDKAKPLVNDWNIRMGSPIKQKDIDYRFTKKYYTFSNKHIDDLLEELGMNKE